MNASSSSRTLPRFTSARTTLSVSKRVSRKNDWAFAKRALARGDDPEKIIQQIARHRASDKADPEYYVRLTVTKALAEFTGFRPEQRQLTLQSVRPIG